MFGRLCATLNELRQQAQEQFALAWRERASVVDAMCHGFKPVVVEDCVGDRALPPHDAALFDMRQKYADLLTLDRLTEQLTLAAR